MKISIVQSKPVAGNLDYNLKKIKEYIEKTKSDNAELVLFSPGSLIGLNIKDLFNDATFCKKIEDINIEFKSLSQNINLLVPTIIEGVEYINYYSNGEFVKSFPASPNDVHDIFGHDLDAAISECVFEIKGKKISVNVPTSTADLNIYTFLSTFDKEIDGNEAFIEAMPETDTPYLILNSAGFCNGIVFSGGSFGISNNEKSVQLKYFEEDYSIINYDNNKITGKIEETPKCNIEATYKAITTSMRDFINDNGFKGFVLGMSGGIDSALVGALAVEAIGSDKVTCLIMPSQYSSNETMSDAEIICNNLGIKYEIIPINTINDTLLKALLPFLANTNKDTTEENLQSRIRGILNMAVSNKTGKCLLATGNKSEAATGYFTLYGDSCGSLAPIVDLYKTEVYELSKYINTIKNVIPESIITRPPSAELAPDQKDNDTLPDYDILDGILALLIDLKSSVNDIVAEGYDKKTVEKVYNLVNKVQFKRCQYPMGISLSETSFQDAWNYPITNKFYKI